MGACPHICAILYGGLAATFHHIYPKSKLIPFGRYIEYLNAYCVAKNINNNVSDAVIRLYDLCFTPAAATPFYWRGGTGFWGYRPEKRKDDPHDSEEKIEPKSMKNQESNLFEASKILRIDCFNEMKRNTDNNKITLNNINKCIDIEAKLNVNPHQTNPWGNNSSDWIDSAGRKKLKEPQQQAPMGKYH